MSSITPDDIASLAAKYDAFLASLTDAETVAFDRIILVAIHHEDAEVEGFAAPSFATVFGDQSGLPAELPGTANTTARTGVSSTASNLLHHCATGKHFPSVNL